MNSHTIPRLPAIFLFTALLSPLRAPAQQYPDSIELTAIRAVLDSQSAAWNKGDIDGYMRGYWQSDSLLFTSGGNMERGWRAARDKYKQSYSTQAKMGVLTFSGIECHLLSEASAWIFGHWMLVRQRDRPHGLFTLIMRRFPDGWKIVHDHTSAEIPKPKPKTGK